MSFKSGLLIGGLGVAVLALVIVVIVLALGGSDESSPTVVVGTTTSEDNSGAGNSGANEKREAVSDTDRPPPAHPGPDSGPTEFFETPSGNISCGLSADSVRCDIADKDWVPYLPKPASCNLDWGNSVSVGAYGSAEFLCAGDTLMGSAEGTLDYGYEIGRGRITCVSQEAGLSCVTPAGEGFFLSAQKVRLF